MRRHRQPSPTSSSDENDDTDLESCFDTGDEAGSTDSDTNLTDCDSDVEEGDEAGGMIIDEGEDKGHPLEYYLNQEDEFNESEYMAEDCSDGSCLLLDFIEERFFQYALCPLSHPQPPINRIDLISLQVLQIHTQGSRTDDEGHLAPPY